MITLDKTKSKNRIEITTDYKMDPDGWFLKVAHVDKKSGNIVHEHCIIKPDLDVWISSFERDNWKQNK